MENKKWEFHTITLRLAAVMLMLVLLTTSIVSGRYARYVTTATGSDEARVAKFKVSHSLFHEDTDLTQSIPLPQITPGETVSVTVKVEMEAEVAVCNTITVTSEYENLPLKFTVKEIETGESGTSPFSVQYAPNDTGTKEYQVDITWDSNGKDQDYMGMVDMLNINVKSVQVD